MKADNIRQDPEALGDIVAGELAGRFQAIDQLVLANTAKVLNAFHQKRVSEFHFKGSTGYGYNDAGRETLESVYAQVFGAQRALVRSQIVCGTHALALGLFGLLQPGDELLSPYGAPYDTLEKIIGIKEPVYGSLAQLGVNYRQVDPLPDKCPDWSGIERAINGKTALVLLQRSGGYSSRPALSIEELGEFIDFIRSRKQNVLIMVDNCYGEFAQTKEPCEVGADLVCGSLIKNPGGGLAPTGGYIAGRSSLVERAAARLTAPGLGAGVGPAPEGWRLYFQGLFLAPHLVGEALKGAVFTSRLMEKMGFTTQPASKDLRTDIIQKIELGSPDLLLAFCRGIQRFSPVDAHVLPEAAMLPGYSDPVIMAAGTFVQGASLELTADAPVRPPYTAYLQGGLSLAHTRLAVTGAVREMLKVWPDGGKCL